MYDFWYNAIKAKYGEKAQLLYIDTDSLMMLIGTPDAYADMWANKHHYDFGDYPKDNQYHDDTNKKVIGKFKDECSSVPIEEFIDLRPKMYSIEKSDLSNIRKAKGIVKSVVEKDLTHELYIKRLQERKQMTHIQVGI